MWEVVVCVGRCVYMSVECAMEKGAKDVWEKLFFLL